MRELITNQAEQGYKKGSRLLLPVHLIDNIKVYITFRIQTPDAFLRFSPIRASLPAVHSHIAFQQGHDLPFCSGADRLRCLKGSAAERRIAGQLPELAG